MKCYPLRIRRGKLLVVAYSETHANRQADAFERDLQRHPWIRNQTEVKPGVFALGSEAKRELGITVFNVPK